MTSMTYQPVFSREHVTNYQSGGVHSRWCEASFCGSTPSKAPPPKRRLNTKVASASALDDVPNVFVDREPAPANAPVIPFITQTNAMTIGTR